MKKPLTLRERIPAGVWEELVEGAPRLDSPAGQQLYATGSAPPVMALLKGSVRVLGHPARGPRIPIHIARTGDLIGLAPNLIDNQATSAETTSPTVTATLPLAHVQAVAARHPELSWEIAAQVARWSSEALRAAVDVARRPVNQRLAERLLELSTETPQGTPHAHVTHKALAAAVGTAREVVTRALHELRAEGVIGGRPGVVLVLDRGRLAKIAAGDGEETT